MSIYVESIIYKTYQYFCIYTVRTEELKDYCDFVDGEYQKLLFHCITRWLSLYPSISRMIDMFPALQSYFLSIAKAPVNLKRFYESSVSVLYLKHLQCLEKTALFRAHCQKVPKTSYSLAEHRRPHCKQNKRSSLPRFAV